MMDEVAFEFSHRPSLSSSKFLPILFFFTPLIVLVYTLYTLPTDPSTSTFFTILSTYIRKRHLELLNHTSSHLLSIILLLALLNLSFFCRSARKSYTLANNAVVFFFCMTNYAFRDFLKNKPWRWKKKKPRM